MSVVCFFLSRSEEDRIGLAYAAELAGQQKQPLRVVCPLHDLANLFIIAAPEVSLGINNVVPPELIEQQASLVERTKTDFHTIIGESPLAPSEVVFEDKYGFTPHIVGEEAVLADLCIFPRGASLSGDSLHRPFMHVLMEGRLPIIRAGVKPNTEGPALVAWDGSEQAARSVRFHLPLLRSATDVVIAHSTENLKAGFDSEARSHQTLQKWLTEKGIESRILEIEGNVGQALLDAAFTTDASVIVSGAYGHSRLGQRIFGGVSKTLFSSQNAPALALCH